MAKEICQKQISSTLRVSSKTAPPRMLMGISKMIGFEEPDDVLREEGLL